jgi:hypothetical protein
LLKEGLASTSSVALVTTYRLLGIGYSSIRDGSLIAYFSYLDKYMQSAITEYQPINDIAGDAMSAADSSKVYKNMSNIIPVYSFVLSKVDKARFKNSRGKSGRYQMTMKFIPRSKGINYMFKYLKHS